MAKEVASWAKPDGLPGLIGRKQVDWSLLVSGSTIPVEFYGDFAQANGEDIPKPGDKHDVVFVIAGDEYPAVLTNVNRTTASPELQLRYSSNSHLVERFQAVFHHSYAVIQATRQAETAAGKKKVYAKLDKSEAEFVDFYATETPYKYRLELIPHGTVNEPPTFDEVWSDLEALIGPGKSVRTLGRPATNFVTWRGPEGLLIRTHSGPELVERTMVEEAWNALRNRRIANAKQLGRGQYRSAAIMTTLTLLPYVDYSPKPVLTLFLRGYQLNESDLVAAFGLQVSGAVRWPKGTVSPKVAFVIAGPSNSRWDGDTLRLSPDDAGRGVLAQSKASTMTLYGFRSDGAGHLSYFGRLAVNREEHGDVLLAGVPSPRPDFRSWIFQANPKTYDLDGAVAHLSELTWLVRQHADDVKAGDEVFLWNAGSNAGVVALATVMADPGALPEHAAEKPFYVSEEKFSGDQLRVPLRIDRVLPARISRTQLLAHPVLSQISILRGPMGTNFALTPEQATELRQFAGAPDLVEEEAPILELQKVATEFGKALADSHIHFGARHDEVVRSFIASLATKPFAILTGLSGSGKTQIALRFGEWLGEGRSMIVPVRPDWTGAEALFGYADALQKGADGRAAWHVPDALAFMLKARDDEDRPYLLVLDEMNLAHVERYFADVLSGMESGQGCLPNLIKDSKGKWQIPPDGPERTPFPRNLFVVGTVNVDETTYMFSPKVLDRANTFEFRVATDELSTDSRKPEPCKPGETALVRGFLEIARDHAWQVDHPAKAAGTFTGHLRMVHKLLSEGGFEFGHRVFYEAIRYAAMLEAAGDAEPVNALDLQIMQKVLPRLYGTRKRLEPILCALGKYCLELTYDEDSVLDGSAIRFNPLAPLDGAKPKLPRSFDKVKRMTRSLRANQFTSFTEQ